VTADEWRQHERRVGSDNTEEAWLACTAADFLLFRAADVRYSCGKGELSERKLRLFGCACCRLLWPFIPDDAGRVAVVAAEDYADGSISADQLAMACDAARECRLPRGRGQVPSVGSPDRVEFVRVAPTRAAASVACGDDGWPFRTHIDDIIGATLEASEYRPFGYDKEAAEASLCELFRDIFGNPFRSVAFTPEWQSDTAVALARRMYDARDFSAMPILADALQDAGCDTEDVLNHCRDPKATHVLGCWVVDLVLGKG
jgi:hypothetical protein